MDAKEVTAPVAGGSFLISETTPADLFTPEDRSEEQRLVRQTVRDFADQELRPNLDRIDEKDWALTRRLLRSLGDMGILGIEVPAAYGGSDVGQVASRLA